MPWSAWGWLHTMADVLCCYMICSRLTKTVTWFPAPWKQRRRALCSQTCTISVLLKFSHGEEVTTNVLTWLSMACDAGDLGAAAGCSERSV